MQKKPQHTALRLFAAVLFALVLPGAGDDALAKYTSSFEQRLLDAHNQERETLDLVPLKWDAALAQGAREWAHHLSTSGRFEHSPTGRRPLGENIWGGTPDTFTPEDMVGLWVAEKRYFRAGVFPANSRTGSAADISHYTQIIWHSTRRVGCAVSQAGAEAILVCRYARPGNIIGRRPLNNSHAGRGKNSSSRGQVVPS